VKQRKAAVCTTTRFGFPLMDGSGSVKGEDGALPQTANPASSSSSSFSSSSSSPPTSAAADWGRETPIG
jgi:hypothetical protein